MSHPQPLPDDSARVAPDPLPWGLQHLLHLSALTGSTLVVLRTDGQRAAVLLESGGLSGECDDADLPPLLLTLRRTHRMVDSSRMPDGAWSRWRTPAPVGDPRAWQEARRRLDESLSPPGGVSYCSLSEWVDAEGGHHITGGATEAARTPGHLVPSLPNLLGEALAEAVSDA
jgi:hypothetical protein